MSRGETSFCYLNPITQSMPNEKPIPQQIPIEKIHDLPGVIDFKLPEKSYGTLVSSILVNGLREPVILRTMGNGEYQLVHGYRRRKAAELAKLKTLDALVYDMTEKEAKDYRVAVAANPDAPIPGKLIAPDTKTPVAKEPPKVEKAVPAEKKPEAAPPSPAKATAEKPAEKKAEHISTYDLSRALRMKADSMKRKAGRKIRGAKSGPETDELIAKEMGMSTMKLNRLMKLSEATRSICDLVDEGRLPTSVAYNIAFLQPKHQDTVADLIGINVKVNNENTGILKKVASTENLTEQKIRDVLEGRYPPKVVEKPKPVVPPPPAAQPMAPASVPKSPDIPVPPVPPAQPKAADSVVPFPSTGAAPTQAAPSATSGIETAPTVTAQTPAAAVPSKPIPEPQDRENSYETKIVLRGDRLRKYFPDVSMTPREIEDSVYDALEMRRQMQEKAKQKAEIFGKEKKGMVK